MTIQIKVKNLGENNRKVNIEMNQGPGFIIPPGSAEVITLHAGQFITSITEGEEAPPMKPEAEFQPTEAQLGEMADLIAAYGDAILGVGGDGIYVVASQETGDEIARGSYADLIAAKKDQTPKEGDGDSDGLPNSLADEAPETSKEE